MLTNKVIFILLVLCLFQQLNMNAYTVKNAGNIPLLVSITLALEARPNAWYSVAYYELQPGQEAAWNENEFRKKYNKQKIAFWVSPILKNIRSRWDYPLIFNGLIPVNANLKITATKSGEHYIGGAVDLSTGTFYDKPNYERALTHIKSTEGKK